MATSKKDPAKKAAPEKEPPKRAASTKAPAKRAAPRKVVPPAAPEAAPVEAPPAKPEAKAPVHKERVVVPMDLYDARKDEVKAPFKEHGLKWKFLGEGKGLYQKEGVNVFVQFKDDGVHYDVWGADQPTVDAILAAWRRLLGAKGFAASLEAGTEARAEEAAVVESDAMRLWRLGKPQPRPGEPDFFFKKRMAEWDAKRPGA